MRGAAGPRDNTVSTCTVSWCLGNYSDFLPLCLSTACASQCLSCEAATGCTSCRDPAKVLLFGECQDGSCAQQHYLDFSSNTCRGEKHIAGLKKDVKKKKTSIASAWAENPFRRSRRRAGGCFKACRRGSRAAAEHRRGSCGLFSAATDFSLPEKQDYCKSFSCQWLRK